jgi:hypothetical protein
LVGVSHPLVLLLGSYKYIPREGRFTTCFLQVSCDSVKLTLMDPSNAEYRQFTDRLLEIYREACRGSNLLSSRGDVKSQPCRST